jgi:NCS1 family nucleobase:cation symporter-1
VTPGLGLLIAFMFYVLFRDYGWETIAAAPPLDPSPTPYLNYLLAVELGIASGISWWGGVGFLARNTRTRRNSIYPMILQLGLAMGIACSIGLFSALVVQSDDPTEWMVPLGGVFMGVLALVFVGLANVTSTAVSFFASGLALRHVPALRSRPWWQLMLLLVIPCVPFVLWPGELYDLGDAFLAYNGTMYAPISGILFTDYFLLRGQRLNLWSIFEDAPSGEYFYSRGFNWIALGSLLLGQATYLFLYNPITGATHEAFRWAPASIAAFLVPALVYGVAMRFLNVAATSKISADPVGATAMPQRLITPNI